MVGDEVRCRSRMDEGRESERTGLPEFISLASKA